MQEDIATEEVPGAAVAVLTGAGVVVAVLGVMATETWAMGFTAWHGVAAADGAGVGMLSSPHAAITDRRAHWRSKPTGPCDATPRKAPPLEGGNSRTTRGETTRGGAVACSSAETPRAGAMVVLVAEAEAEAVAVMVAVEDSWGLGTIGAKG